MDKRNRLTKSLLWISETTGLSAQAAIHALAMEKRGDVDKELENTEEEDPETQG
ncbi:hypothetical protein [Sulfobacillus sp. hq2]|uniref:hypothetical protein n=1 Tax=Sulfobacillus TaxID=28033 RepID=UPI001304EF01|nr:hypothetical protein [Sulfobacillus sp. hq2]